MALGLYGVKAVSPITGADYILTMSVVENTYVITSFSSFTCHTYEAAHEIFNKMQHEGRQLVRLEWEKMGEEELDRIASD